MTEHYDPAFDSLAAEYDNSFTRSWIGRRQRDAVWKFLENNIHVSREKTILELNCGTGEDACMLAEKGHSVLATDVSERMLEQTRLKQRERSIENLELKLLDINSPSPIPEGRRFDMVFSNFGGLNCSSPDDIKLLSASLSDCLNKDGKLILVVMGRKCIWEKIYFLFKGMRTQAGRRSGPGPVEVNLGDSVQKTWYYSPEEMTELLKDRFTKIQLRPIGLFIPPSYLESGLKRINFLKSSLLTLDRMLSRFSLFANYADHFLIEFRKKE